MHCIFRRIDGVLLYCAKNDNQLANEWAACLENEGGPKALYVEHRGISLAAKDHVLHRTPMGVIEQLPLPQSLVRQAAIAAARVEMESLGLSAETINLMVL